ncbi:hypothetical protein GGR58DRAFT_466102 [Xylaria digitata]|nr:hypothetical protein GGR58DRAFT_466102 [Xylaria digitata]
MSELETSGSVSATIVLLWQLSRPSLFLALLSIFCVASCRYRLLIRRRSHLSASSSLSLSTKSWKTVLRREKWTY